MKVQRFKNFESYCASIANVDLRMRVLGFEHPGYAITQADVRGMHVQLASEGAGQLAEGATNQHGVALYLPLRRRPISLNGVMFNNESVACLVPGADFRFSGTRASDWCSVFIPLDLLFECGNSVFPLHDSVIVQTPPREVVTKLHSILTFINNLSRNPSLLNSAATDCFQEEFLGVARQLCTKTQKLKVAQRSEARARYDLIATEAAERIEASLDGSVSVERLARELNVSERTFLTAFKSHFAVTPRHFIQSLRLNRARAMLREYVDQPDAVRIRDIAAVCGFWDFGRFAEKYRRLFGELPTDTVGK